MAFFRSNDLWLNSPDPLSSLTVTPRTPAGRIAASIKSSRLSKDRSELSLALKTTIGTTTSTASAFDYNTATSSFAICAGSVAIVARVDEELNITQKFFRARPSASSHISPSSNHDKSIGASTPESRNHLVGSLRRKTFGLGPIRSPQIDHSVSPGKANIRQKTRVASCVSLSSDGRLLAVSETGYNPRILIFSTLDNGSTDPLSTLAEHTFGIRCLAFSQDSRWLCSVGDSHDGFVFLWAINPKTGNAKLHSANKCISSVQGVAWMGISIVTVGTRHVKLWRGNQSAPSSPSKTKPKADIAEPAQPSSPGLSTLHGRNCLLGSLLDATFTCVEAISDTKAVLCTERGSICVLDDGDCMRRLYQVSSADFSIKCLSVDYSTNHLFFSGKGGDVLTTKLDDLAQLEVIAMRGRSTRTSSSSSSTTDDSVGLVALGSLPTCLVAINSSHSIQLYSKEDQQTGYSRAAKLREAPAHRCAALGVRMIAMSESRYCHFFTWSADGSVNIWTLDGIRKATFEVSLDQWSSSEGDGLNELTVVRASSDGSFFIAGDKIGTLRLLEGDSGIELLAAKVHVREINDIAIVRLPQDTVLVATCGRDRNVQIFTKQPSKVDLIQTIDQHASSVNQLQFINEGSALLSSSSDRTIMIHTLATTEDSMAYILTRIITLKSTPISMITEFEDPNILIISTMDKQIHKFELSSGQQIRSMRLTDDESNDLIPLTSLASCVIGATDRPISLLIGVCPADKSIRVHNSRTGATLYKEYGHSEGISDLAIVNRGEGLEGLLHAIISTGLDGTIMIWELEYRTFASLDEDPSLASLGSTPTISKPLRRVLSRTSLTEYYKSLEADGVLALPLVSSRSQSPSRLRKKTSRYSLAPPAIASPTMKLISSSALARQFQPVPSSPTTPVNKRQRPPLPEFHRTQSASNLSKLHDLNAAAEQLHNFLAAFRKKLSTTTEKLSAVTATDLQTELTATLGDVQLKQTDTQATNDIALGHPAQNVSKRGLAASEADVDSFLGMYSERLARMVEMRVMAEMNGRTRDNDEYKKTWRENGGGNPPAKIDRLGTQSESEAVTIKSEGKG